MVDTVFSKSHALWPRLIVVSLMKEFVGRMEDLISIYDRYFLSNGVQDSTPKD